MVGARPYPAALPKALTIPPSDLDSVFSRVLRQAHRRGENDAYIFLEHGETIAGRLSYEQLIDTVERMGAGLVGAGLRGEPVAIMLPPGLAFACVFLACLAAQAIAIPLPYPVRGRTLDRISAILADAGPTAIVTDQAAISKYKPEFGGADESCRLLTPEDLAAHGASAPFERPRPDAIAFVQYTSGATRSPVGVAVTHANLVANERMIEASFGHREGWVTVSWLPHFHDMGLMGSVLQPLLAGGTAVFMSPLAFIQKPVRWLRAIERFGAACAGGPCLGYDLCLRRIGEDEARALDLSRWRLAFCGAEPVRASVLGRFAERFAPAGFDRRALMPCYGLAEATLIVASVRPGTGLSEARVRTGTAARLSVSCGPPVEGCDILIRGENGEPAGPGEAGEICVAGPNLAPGLWSGERRCVVEFPSAFRDATGARYLPTGDVGAMLGGELFPIDRLKDTIIIHGTKLHAIDVEATLLDGGFGGEVLAAVAFAAEGEDREDLVLLCEVDRATATPERLARLAKQVPRRVGEDHGVLPKVVFLPRGALPRTSSGKLRRQSSKDLFLTGGLSPIAFGD